MTALLSRLSISRRLSLIVISAVIVLAAVITLDAYNLRGEMMQEKKLKTEQLVQTATGVLQYYDSLAGAGGALALISGRSVADIDGLFAPLRLAAH